MTPTPITFRPALISDAPAMLDFATAIMNEQHNNISRDPGHFHATVTDEHQHINNFQDRTKGLLLLGVEHDRVIAMAEILRASRLTRSHVASLGMSVARDYRHLGIGTQLMTHLLAWAKEQKILRVELEVLDRNQNAIHLYRKFGFKEEGHHPMAYCKQGIFVEAISMALLI